MNDAFLLALGNALLAVSGGIVVLTDFFVPGIEDLLQLKDLLKREDSLSLSQRFFSLFVSPRTSAAALKRRARLLRYGPFLICWLAGVALTLAGYGFL